MIQSRIALVPFGDVPAPTDAIVVGMSVQPAPGAMLCGVAGGIAEYLDVDPTIVRLGLVVALVFGHIVTFVLYVAACLIIPEQPLFD
jgi:phage shock protein C